MSDNKVEVDVVATTEKLAPGMNSATNVIQTAMSRIKTALDGVKSSSSQMVGAFVEGCKTGAAEAKAEAASVEESAARINKSGSVMSGAFAALGPMIAAIGIAEIGRAVVGVISNFERLRSVLTTLEGSEGGGNARFAELKKFATETPYDLAQVVESFSMLKSQGLDPSNKALTSYGNTASAMGKSLDQMINAVADAAMGEFERLKEFGIKTIDAGDSVIFNFQGQATKVKKNSEDIQDYLQGIGNVQFGGAMQRQMDTLGGALSNVGDAVANFADDIGKGGLSQALQDVIGEMTNAATGSGNLAQVIGSVLGVVIKEIWGVIKTLGEVVGSVFQTIADVIRRVVGENVSNGEIWQKSINLIKIAFIQAGAAINIAAVIIGAAINSVIVWIEALSEAITKFSVGDFTGAGQALASAVDKQVDIVRKGAKDVADISVKAAADTREAWSAVDQPKKEDGKVSTYTKTGGSTFGKSSNAGANKAAAEAKRAEDVEIQGYENKLAALKLAQEKENDANGTFYQFTKEQEAKYWKDILDTTTMSAREKALIEKRYLDLSIANRKSDFDDKMAGLKRDMDETKYNYDKQLEIATQIATAIGERYGLESKEYAAAQTTITKLTQAKAAQVLAINQLIADSNRDAALAGIDEEQRAAQLKEQLGLETKAELIAQETQFEDKRFEIVSSALEERLALMANDPNTNPVEMQRIKNEILEIERQHQAKINELHGQATEESTLQSRTAADSIGQSWGQSIAKMATLQASFGATVKSMYMAVVDVVSNALAKMIGDWIAQQLKMMIFNKLFKTTTAAGQITANAGIAGSAAFASTAAIPIVGPALAPAAAALATAGALSFLPMASAANGYDIPGGINPVTQLHEREMVLPEEHADTIRNMKDGGQAPIGDIHIHAMDTRSVRKFVMDNKHEIAAAVKAAYEEGSR